MSSLKKVIVAISCVHSSMVFSQDYFNPLFLGSDISSVADLSYLNNGNDIVPGDYYLDLFISDNFFGNQLIKFYENRNTKKVIPCFTKEIIEVFPFNKEGLELLNLDHYGNNQCINIEAKMPDFGYTVDLEKSALIIAIPQIYVQSHFSTLAPEKYWDDGITALVTNYNFSGSYTKNKESDNSQSYYLNLENRFNWGPWRAYANGYFYQTKYGSDSDHEFRTNNMFVSRSINNIKSELIIGQQTKASSIFDSMSFVGVGLMDSYQMKSENEKGYTPPIRGIVESRSKIVVRQSGSIIYQSFIDAGPYDINDITPSGSSGNYEVEITAADGSVTTYSVPYSAVTNLLKEGLSTYSVAAGYLDIRGSRKEKFVQADYSRGLSMKVTAYMGTQLSANYRSLGFGLAKDFGSFGALSADFITAKSILDSGETNSGQSYRFLYGKTLETTGTNFQITGYRYSTSGYYSFTEASYKTSGYNGSYGSYMSSTLQGKRKNSYQINLSQRLGSLGQVYAWGDVTDYWGGTSSTNLQFGWSRTFDFLTGLTVNATYNKFKYDGSKRDYFYLSFNLPITSYTSNDNLYLSNSTTYIKGSRDVINNSSLHGSLFDNKLNYNISENLSNHDDTHSTTGLNATYYADIAQLQLGTSLSKNVKQFDYSVSGSFLVHEDGLVFSRSINESPVLIEAKGAAGTKITNAGNNISIGNDGYAMLPYSQPYKFNNIELDASSFDDNYDIQDKVARVVPTKGAITKVKFNVISGYNFLVMIDYQGQPIPFGAKIMNLGNGATSISDEDGLVYLSGVEDNASFEVNLNANTSCHFNIKYGDNFVASTVNNLNVTCL